MSRRRLTDARPPQVYEGDTYMLTKAERDIISARTMAKARAERIKQVREQERLWARHKAREYRASVKDHHAELNTQLHDCLLYTSPSPRDKRQSRMPSSA